MMPADIDIEAVVLRKGSFASQMPFTGEKGGITSSFEGLRQGRIFFREAPGVSRGEQFGVSFPVLFLSGANPIGDIQTCWILAGHETSS